jgi:hypothetical protein
MGACQRGRRSSKTRTVVEFRAMRRMTRRFNAYVRAQPRRAGIIFGIASGLLLFAATATVTQDVSWSVFSGLSTAIGVGLALYSIGTWDRGW